MGFLDFINGAIGGLESFLNDIAQLIVQLFNLLIKVFVFLWNNLVLVAQYALKALKSVASFFGHLWERLVKDVFPRIVDAIRKVHAFLEQHLRPIINFLKKAHAFLQKHVFAPLKAYIQFLQRIRRYLTILRFLHIKWAEALDRRLQQAEVQTGKVLLEIQSLFNTIISWVNAASDPLRLGRMVLFSTLGRRTAGAAVRILTGLPLGVFFPTTGKGSHLWEQPILRASDINDAQRNPPASQILLGLTPLLIDGFDTSDPTPSDTDLDSLETVPYFDDLTAWLFTSADLFDGMDSPRISITDTITQQAGQLHDAGKVLRDWLSSAVTV